MNSNPATAVSFGQAGITDTFWSAYIQLVRDVVIPYQWEALNDRVPEAEPSHAVRNFEIAAGLAQGEFHGMVFQDSDVAKWLEAVAYLLAAHPDPDLESLADGIIEVIGRAQQPDGYLNTYFTLKEPGKRWTNLAECHELYCAGHLIEAAVAYHQATGKRKLLDIVCRFADHIDSVFGPEPGKLHGYDGHQEIELALVKLYKETGNDKYWRLSRYFLDQRGTRPHYYEEERNKRGGGPAFFPELRMSHDYAYSQAHLPVRDQTTAEGHAVRAVYMCAAMADVAALAGDAAMLAACKRLWRNIVARRMYITGGIGSQAYGESFSADYDLPSDTMYAESCASIGLIFFARRMLELEPDSEYADVLERALYNTVVSGMSRDGKKFFYVNPLEVHPQTIGCNHNYRHVKLERQGWFGCACCPPNIARLLASLGQYVYGFRARTVYTHLYIGSRAEWKLDDGARIALEQDSGYTWQGQVRMRVQADRPADFRLALRMPSWSDSMVVRVNGIAVAEDEGEWENGYRILHRKWHTGDEIAIEFDMSVHRMTGHPLIRQTAGKVALQRGPFVYCMEEADNGPHLHQFVLPADGALQVCRDDRLLDGMRTIRAEAVRIGSAAEDWQDVLYRKDAGRPAERAEAVFIPYFAWANRGVGEMAVWVKSQD